MPSLSAPFCASRATLLQIWESFSAVSLMLLARTCQRVASPVPSMPLMAVLTAGATSGRCAR